MYKCHQQGYVEMSAGWGRVEGKRGRVSERGRKGERHFREWGQGWGAVLLVDRGW